MIGSRAILLDVLCEAITTASHKWPWKWEALTRALSVGFLEYLLQGET